MSDYGFTASPQYSIRYQKDPSDVTDYAMSWAHLGNDTIASSNWSSDGLTVGTGTFSGLTPTTFVSGGDAGSVYKLTNAVTTTCGRTLERSYYIEVIEL